MKQINPSGEFAGFGSGKPKLIRHHITQAFSPRFKKGEKFIHLEPVTEVNTSFVQLEAANFAPDEFMQVTSQSTEDHFYSKNLVCFRKN